MALKSTRRRIDCALMVRLGRSLGRHISTLRGFGAPSCASLALMPGKPCVAFLGAFAAILIK